MDKVEMSPLIIDEANLIRERMLLRDRAAVKIMELKNMVQRAAYPEPRKKNHVKPGTSAAKRKAQRQARKVTRRHG